jgi:hypothetical protein
MPRLGVKQKLTMRAAWALSSLRDWTDYRRRRAAFRAAARGSPIHSINEPIGHRTRHTFEIANGEVLTTFQMDQRWRIVARLYPKTVTSLLDIGCCRGWFVVRAAMLPECERALGVDVVGGFIDAANKAKELLKLDKAQFDYAFLNDVAGDVQRYRTPYQTIVLLNTYHYMYWGSSYSDKHWPDHDYLLRTLAAVCTDRIIFMSPLEVADCPSDIARRAQEHPDWASHFTTDKFLSAAGRYFDVGLRGYLGLRPLYLMTKRDPVRS